jgi:hypothetical protein
MLITNLLVMILFSLSGNYESGRKKIVVIGIAEQVKVGAYVMSDDSTPYYLDGVTHWENEILGKRVRVAGELIIEEFYQTDTPGIVQGRRLPDDLCEIEEYFILKPKWKLVK